MHSKTKGQNKGQNRIDIFACISSMHEIPFTILFCIQRKISVIDYFAPADTCTQRVPNFFVWFIAASWES